MKKLLVFLLLSVFLLPVGAARAEDSRVMYLLASKAQIAEMDEVLKELEFNGVRVKIVSPDKLDILKDAQFAAVVYTPDSPLASLLANKISEDVQNTIQKKGGSRLLVLTNPFAEDQEWIVWAGNTEADAAQLRREKRTSWWSVMASWYDILIGGLSPY